MRRPGHASTIGSSHDSLLEAWGCVCTRQTSMKVCCQKLPSFAAPTAISSTPTWPGTGPRTLPGMVLIHHLPGWDELYREFTRRFAHHGFVTISPNLYYRDGHGTPEDVAAKVRAAGGVPDAQMLGDVEGALRYLRAMPNCSGKVGCFGTCSADARRPLPPATSTSMPPSIAGVGVWSWPHQNSTPRIPLPRLI